MRSHTKEATCIVTYFIFLTIFVFSFHIDKVVGGTLYFLIPTIFLMIENWKSEREAILFTILTGIAGGVVFESINYLNNIWHYTPNLPSIRIGTMPMEAVIWYVMWVGLTVSVYKTFFDPHRHRLAHHHSPFYRHKHFLFVVASVLAIYAFVFNFQPGLLTTPYAYAKFGSLAVIIPIIYALVRHPKLVPQIFKFTLSLFGFALAWELVGLHAGWWTYPGEFLYVFNFGALSLSLEELVLWIILGSSFVATFYEEYETDLR